LRCAFIRTLVKLNTADCKKKCGGNHLRELNITQSVNFHKAAYAATTNPDLRKTMETAGTVIAEPITLQQLDSFYKKEATTGAAIAKSINLQAQQANGSLPPQPAGFVLRPVAAMKPIFLVIFRRRCLLINYLIRSE
jgi:hypothetical protein